MELQPNFKPRLKRELPQEHCQTVYAMKQDVSNEKINLLKPLAEIHHVISPSDNSKSGFYYPRA